MDTQLPAGPYRATILVRLIFRLDPRKPTKLIKLSLCSQSNHFQSFAQHFFPFFFFFFILNTFTEVFFQTQELPRYDSLFNTSQEMRAGLRVLVTTAHFQNDPFNKTTQFTKTDFLWEPKKAHLKDIVYFYFNQFYLNVFLKCLCVEL